MANILGKGRTCGNKILQMDNSGAESDGWKTEVGDLLFSINPFALLEFCALSMYYLFERAI